jgi:hypothetical protein
MKFVFASVASLFALSLGMVLVPPLMRAQPTEWSLRAVAFYPRDGAPHTTTSTAFSSRSACVLSGKTERSGQHEAGLRYGFVCVRAK